jgi:hypothetical protein
MTVRMDRPDRQTSMRFALSVVLSVLAVASPCPARGAEVVTARPPADWNLEVGASYAATNDFGGWGIALRGGWLASPYVVLGAGVETTRLHAEGVTSGDFVPAHAYSQTFQTTFPAVFVRGQLPLRRVTPYVELAAGLVVIHSQQGEYAQCSYGNGPGAGLALGVDAQVAPSNSVGLRAGVRNPGWGVGCSLVGGPWTFQDDFRMTSLALTSGFRW